MKMDTDQEKRLVAGVWVTLLSAVLLLPLVAVGGCKKGEDAGGETVIQNSGSDTMVNLAQMWAEEYRKVEPNVSVEVSGGGSGVGISNLIKGLTTIANASRDMTESEKQQAKANTGQEAVETIVGYDAIAIYVHKDNPIEEISMEDLAAIYGEDGQITKWSQLGVKVSQDEIVTVSRQNSSGTYAFFREHVLEKKRFRNGMLSMAGSKDVVDVVGKTAGAIGYSGMGYKTDEVKFVKVMAKKGEPAYLPTLENVRDKHYALARSLNVYTLGQPEGHVKKYIDWILSKDGQAVVRKAGYIAVEDLKTPAAQ